MCHHCHCAHTGFNRIHMAIVEDDNRGNMGRKSRAGVRRMKGKGSLGQEQKFEQKGHRFGQKGGKGRSVPGRITALRKNQVALQVSTKCKI